MWLSTVSVPPRLPPICAWVRGVWTPFATPIPLPPEIELLEEPQAASPSASAPATTAVASCLVGLIAASPLCRWNIEVHRAALGLSASCRPSPSRLKASTVSSSASPGKVMYHQAVLKIGVAAAII